MDCVVTDLFISWLILLYPHQSDWLSLSAILWISHRISPIRSGLIIPSNKFIITLPGLHVTRGRCSLTIFHHKSQPMQGIIFISAFIFCFYITGWCGHISLSGTRLCSAEGQILPTRRQLCSASLRFLPRTYVGCRGLWLSQAVAPLGAG